MWIASCWRRMKTARARRSAGTSWRSSSRRSRTSEWCSTRSPRRPSSRPSTTSVRSTSPWSRPRRVAGSSTACTAMRFRPFCGARSSRGCPPVACRASPPRFWWTASAHGCASARPSTGTLWRSSRPRAATARAKSSRRDSFRLVESASPAARTSIQTPASSSATTLSS